MSSTLEKKRPEDFMHLLMNTKHTRFEGLVIEYELEQTLLKEFKKNGWAKVEALVIRRVYKNTQRQQRSEEFIVIPRENAIRKDIFHLCNILKNSKLPVRIATVSGNTIHFHHDEHGKRVKPPITKDFSYQKNSINLTSTNVIDENRVMAMYWGFASNIPERFCTFAEEIHIKDHIIEPDSNFIWDLDCFLISPDGERAIYIEAKHKYPFRNGKSLRFGMNLGEISTSEILLETGKIDVWHIILVKPLWEKNVSSTYLFYDRNARERALWIAGNMATMEFENPINARRETSLHGQHSISFRPIISPLHIIGKNSEDSEELSSNLYSMVVENVNLPELTDKELLRVKIR